MPRFAWPSFEEPWECNITTVRLDGTEANDTIESDHLRVEVHDREWARAALSLTAVTDQPLPSGLNAVQAHVLASCPATQLRRPYPLELIEDNGSCGFHGSIELPRTAVAAKATLTVEIAAEHNGRRRVVGTAVPWTLIVDKADAPEKPGVPPLKTIWVNFRDGEAPAEARRNAGAHAYVDVRSSPPILYLNKGIDGLQSLILADRPKLERRRHRDLISAFIARYVASSLFRAAAEQVAVDEFGGPAEGPTVRVFRDVCEAVAAELPDTDTVQDLYEVIAHLPDGPPDSSVFWADVDLALDRMTAVSSTVATISEQVKHV
jgi:hypothetical protein